MFGSEANTKSREVVQKEIYPMVGGQHNKKIRTKFFDPETHLTKTGTNLLFSFWWEYLPVASNEGGVA